MPLLTEVFKIREAKPAWVSRNARAVSRGSNLTEPKTDELVDDLEGWIDSVEDNSKDPDAQSREHVAEDNAIFYEGLERDAKALGVEIPKEIKKLHDDAHAGTFDQGAPTPPWDEIKDQVQKARAALKKMSDEVENGVENF